MVSDNPSRRAILAATAAIAVAATTVPAMAREPNAPPNILFIMADDLGYADLSAYGRRDYRTPVLDKLAKSGVMLRHAYANSPVCSPTRAALLTGNYQYRYAIGLPEPIGPDPRTGIPQDIPTLPGILRSLGYRTSLVGKWHLGYPPSFVPLNYGYDSFFGIHEGGTDYYSHQLVRDGKGSGGLYDGNRLIERPGYLTDLLADRAIAEIEAAAAARKPFFISLHFTAPHWPWEDPDDAESAKSVADSNHWDGGSLRTYAKMMQSLDDNVGKVLAKLDKARIARDTIVVFTSDNGGERFSDTWPLIGMKGEVLEGGIRVPLLVRWPGRIKPASQSDQVMISMDFLPTLVAAAGGTLPAGTSFDGTNLLGVLTGKAAPEPRKLYWRFKARSQRALRDGNWKYVSIGGDDFLFNLAEDERERANLKDKFPDRLSQMKADWAKWNAAMLPYPENSLSSDTRSKTAD